MLCYTRFNMPTTKQKQTKKTSHPVKRLAPNSEANEADSTYLLKLVLYVLLGTFWLKLASPILWLGMPIGAIPFGLLLGLVLVRWFEKYQTDRKIWYAILVVVTILGYFVPAGIVI
jgi:Flp pilus assembly protein TadB